MVFPNSPSLWFFAPSRGHGLSRRDNLDIRGGDEPKVGIIGKGETDLDWLAIALQTRDALVDWIAARGDAPGPLFVRMDPGVEPGSLIRMGGDGASRMVTRLGGKAGLKKKARAHGLRHHAISRFLYLSNGNIVEAQVFARHKDPITTIGYNDARLDVGGKAARLLADDE